MGQISLAVLLPKPGPLWTDAYKMTMACMGVPLRQEEALLYARKRTSSSDATLELSSTYPGMVWSQLFEADVTRAHVDQVTRAKLGLTLPDAYWAAVQVPPRSESSSSVRGVHLHAYSACWSALEPALLGQSSGLFQMVKRLEGACAREADTLSPRRRKKKFHVFTQDDHALFQHLAFDTDVDRSGVSAQAKWTEAANPWAEPVLNDSLPRWVRSRVEYIFRVADEFGLPRENLSEGGLRSAFSVPYHRAVVLACAEAGMTATSNLALAHEFGLRAVGTTGHEHCQRFGSDLEAFTVQAERLPGYSTFLLDTYDTLHSGLPSALEVMSAFRGRAFGVRPDNEETQERDFVTIIAAFKHRGFKDACIDLSGSMNPERLRWFCRTAKEMGFPLENLHVMFGDYLVRLPELPVEPDFIPVPYRGSFSTVLKLVKTGGRPTRKGGYFDLAGPKASPLLADEHDALCRAQAARSIRLALKLESSCLS